MHLSLALDAARRERCDWGLTIREHGISALLPHLTHLRSLARVLALSARVKLADGDFDGAMESLQAGYSLAHGLNNEAVLVQALVGSAIAQTMLRRVEEFVQTSGSPNLYWALACLPRPFIDTRHAIQMERGFLQFSFPALKDVRRGTFSREQFFQMIHEFQTWIEMAGDSGGMRSMQGMQDMAIIGMLMLYKGVAEQYVSEVEGLPLAKVQQMQPHQVMAMYLVGSYDETMDSMAKWTCLPYWQGRRGLEGAENQMRRVPRIGPAALVMGLVPAIKHAWVNMILVDRQIASLQTVEALRAFAATHQGKLPARLEDMTDTPAPIDPITGRLFSYELRDGTAIIDVPAPEGQSPSRGWKYEITLGNAE